MLNIKKEGNENDELSDFLGDFLTSFKDISDNVSCKVEEIIYFTNGLNSETSIRELYFAGNDDYNGLNTRIIHLLSSYFFEKNKKNIMNDELPDINKILNLGNLLDLDLDDFAKMPGVGKRVLECIIYMKKNLIIK